MTNENQKRLTSTKRLSLLYVIVKKAKADFYIDLIQEYESNMQIVAIGNGTTKSAVFTDEVGSKAVIMAIVTDDNIKKILSVLQDKFQTVRDGKGVAWTVPFSSVMGVTFFNFLSNNKSNLI